MLARRTPWCAVRASRENISSGPTQSPISNTVSLRCCQVEVLAATRANITSDGRRYIWCRTGSKDRRLLECA